jgi:hypothetical protein
MDPYDGLKKAGTFSLPSGIEVQGELALKGDETTLDLYAKDFFNTRGLKDGSLTGTFLDRSKVSLIDCITTQGFGSGSRGGERYHFSTIFPHYVIFGDEHIAASDRRIAEVTFLIDDATSVFYDFDAFGSVFDGRALMEKIAEAEKAKENGRDIAIGEHPQVFYFTGKHEIVTAETTLGRVSAGHSHSFSMPGPAGIIVENKILVNIAFEENATVSESLEKFQTLLRFLEIIAGRPQNVLQLKFRLRSDPEKHILLDVYSCMASKRDDRAEERRPHPADLPIQAARAPDAFTGVLTKWLARHDEWRNARFRFSTAFAGQHHYTVDRLVGAANMFDILPSSAVPTRVALSQDVKDAKAAAKAIFQELPNTLPERQSILDALGRLGKSSLRQKILSRAKLIVDALPERFPELALLVGEAVRCRNYFVHGSKTKIDYGRNTELVTFFTMTLEFIFAASDLLECGWDIKAWSTQGSTGSHPFNRFLDGYELGLDKLKKQLEIAKLTADASAD